MSDSETIKCELAVIGTGMAGTAASLFAANRDLSVLQAGQSAGIIFASGFTDLMGIHPLEEKKEWRDPWAAIDALVRDIPNHPYARMEKKDIRAAFDEFLCFLQEAGLPYYRREDHNIQMLTSVGTLKTTYCVPQTMQAGITAIEQRQPCLIVDFKGLKGFSARQIAEALGDKWPGLRAVRITFPEIGERSEIYAEQMARELDFSENAREALARTIKPHIGNARFLGMPAIIGIYHSDKILGDLEKKLGIPVFEIPTLPPALPGLRLKEILEARIPGKGVRLFSKHRIFSVQYENHGNFLLNMGREEPEQTIRAKGIIMATGRFLGGGLMAQRKRVREPLFDLPVFQPASRTEWHSTNFLDPGGHLINRAGLETDEIFRPLDREGHPAFPTLFAAGSILAHQDWMRMKCGSGLAIATAYQAVNAFLNAG